jgi:hypothetical protein
MPTLGYNFRKLDLITASLDTRSVLVKGPSVSQGPDRIKYLTFVTVEVKDSTNNPAQISVPIVLNPGGYNPPIVLDLDGDGVELTSLVGSPVRFDVDGDGSRDQTGWAGPDDGILALDRNGNGIIDTNSEISFSADIGASVSDLEGLRAFDANANGCFDDGDAQFAEFRVWKDTNQNGISEASELLTLAEAGVKAFNLTLNLTGQSIAGATDNVIYSTTEYVRYDGTTRDVGDVFFAYTASGAPAGSVAGVADLDAIAADAEATFYAEDGVTGGSFGGIGRAPLRPVVPIKPAKPVIRFAGFEPGAPLPEVPADIRAAYLARTAPAAATVALGKLNALSFAGLPESQVRELAAQAGYTTSQINSYISTGQGLRFDNKLSAAGRTSAIVKNDEVGSLALTAGKRSSVVSVTPLGQSGGGTVVDTGVAYDQPAAAALAPAAANNVASKSSASQIAGDDQSGPAATATPQTSAATLSPPSMTDKPTYGPDNHLGKAASAEDAINIVQPEVLSPVNDVCCCLGGAAKAATRHIGGVVALVDAGALQRRCFGQN